MAYIKQSDGHKIYTDLTLQLWKKIYEKLYGGFEDLTSTGNEDADIIEEEEAEENDEYAELEKTSAGYAKDGFVVDDADADDEEYQEKPKKKAGRKKKTGEVGAETIVKVSNKPRKKSEPKKTTRATKKEKERESEQNANDNSRNCYYDCDSELSEEEYL